MLAQIVRKMDTESQRAGRKQRRNPAGDLRREVAIMRDLRHKNIVTLRVGAARRLPFPGGCFLFVLASGCIRCRHACLPAAACKSRARQVCGHADDVLGAQCFRMALATM